jgi:hypothetical protein
MTVKETNPDGSPADLSGATATFSIYRNGFERVTDLDTDESGQMPVSGATDTLLGRYSYKLPVTADGVTTCPLYGSLLVVNE